MRIRVSDPLALLPYQTGILSSTRENKAAEGNPASALDSNQKALELGQPVPIIFAKYVDNVGTDNDYGGVFVSPGAVLARYDDITFYPINPDGTPNVLRVDMTFVLSQGQLGEIRTRDVYQRACRKGTASAYYGGRAGTLFFEGNFIDYTDLWVCPTYCGTDDGSYEDLTTLYYRNYYAPGDDTWTRQVHVFIRNGIKVPRIIAGGVDSSNNMIDLALYLIRQTSRVPELLIDNAAMLNAARFTEANGFTWDGILAESYNLEEWMRSMASNFLLRVSDNNGRKGFRPRLPLNEDHTIYTGVVSWKYGFTEEHIVTGGFQIEYIPLSERKAICALMVWRQQPPNDIGFIRTTEVRIDGEAVDGPFEQFDMSQFCTRENHAVKVGAYEVARRKYVTHSLRIRIKPDSFNTILSLGDIVRVQLRRENEPGVVTYHDYLYEVEKINKTQSGVVELDLIHFPIDALGRSVLALYVAGAEGTGFLYDVGRNDYSCDDPDNAEDDTPIPTDTGTPNPDPPDTDVDLPQPGTDVDNPPDDAPVFPPGSGQGGSDTPTNYPPAGSPTSPNPNDPFDTDSPGGGATVTTTRPNEEGPLVPGDTVTVTLPCSFADLGAYWYNRLTGTKIYVDSGDIVFDPNTPFQWVINITNPLGIDPFDASLYELRVSYCCPDPGRPNDPDVDFPECNEQPVADYAGGGLTVSPTIRNYTVRWTITTEVDDGFVTECGGAQIIQGTGSTTTSEQSRDISGVYGIRVVNGATTAISVCPPPVITTPDRGDILTIYTKDAAGVWSENYRITSDEGDYSWVYLGSYWSGRILARSGAFIDAT